MAGGALDRWKRTWWVFLPLVSLGLLAFVPFAIAGKRAGRRDWLVWSLVYAVAAWGASFSGWFGDEPARSVAGILFLVAIGGFTHALWIRRPFLEATGGLEESRRDPVRSLRIWCVLIGVASTIAGVIALFAGPSALVAGGACALGLGFLGVSAMYVTPSPHALPVLREGALVFPYRVWVVRSGGAGLLSIGLSLILFTVGGDVSGFERVAMLVGGPLMAVPAVLILRAARDPHLAATPEGLVARTTFSKVALPWEIVTDLGLFSLGVVDAIGVEVSDPTRIRMPLVDRISRVLEFRDLPEVVYPARQLEADPRAVVGALRHYWQHPEDRVELGTPASLRRFETLMEGGSPTGP